MAEVEGLRRTFKAANGKGMQTFKQRRHARDAVHNELSLHPVVRVQVRFLEKEFREHGNGPERFSQVVRHSVCKLLQPRVRTHQFVDLTLAVVSLGFTTANLTASDHDRPYAGFIEEVRQRALHPAKLSVL